MEPRRTEDEPRGDVVVVAALARPRRGRGPCPPGPKKAPLAIDEVTQGMIVRTLSVAPSEVVFVKGIIEASDGVAALFAVSGGELSIAAPLGRERDLIELVADLAAATSANGTPAQ